jgi:hypothetical protein
VVLLLWKNNIADFTINVQENSDPGHPDDCMLLTENNNDGCKVEQIARCRLNNNFERHLNKIKQLSLVSSV